MSNVVYVTKQWYLKLEEELKNLKEVKRIEIAEKLKEAISYWDLSENSEYEDARNEQAALEKRISDLELEIKNAEIIEEDDTKKTAKDRVTMGSVVTIEDLTNKETNTYKIVGSTESDILADLPQISNESAVWNALLGKKKWDKVKVEVWAWTFEYKIVKLWDK